MRLGAVESVSPVERMIMQLVVRYGGRIIYNNVKDERGELHDLTVAQFIYYSLTLDNLSFSADVFNRMLGEAVERSARPGFDSEQYFLHHEDIGICQIATRLTAEEYHLSPQKPVGLQNEEAERQREANFIDDLRNEAAHLLLDFRLKYVEGHLTELRVEMSRAMNDVERLKKIMADYQDMQGIRNTIAKQLGNNIIA